LDCSAIYEEEEKGEEEEEEKGEEEEEDCGRMDSHNTVLHFGMGYVSTKVTEENKTFVYRIDGKNTFFRRFCTHLTNYSV
jgi:hypothetical protein